MKSNVRLTNPKYIINDKATICTFKCVLDFIDFGSANYALLSKLRETYPKIQFNSMTAIFTITGVSKCHDNDSFDEIKGRRIAESRAKAKIYKLASDIYYTIYHYAQTQINKIDKLSLNNTELYARELKHLQKLSK